MISYQSCDAERIPNFGIKAKSRTVSIEEENCFDGSR